MATQTTLLGLTKPDYSDVQDVGVINANMEIIDNEMGKRSRAYNLLVNSDFSDFRNLVNQRRQTSYSVSNGYTIDGWKGAPCVLSINSNYLSISRGSTSYAIFAQFTPNAKEGKKYTLAAQTAEGEIATFTFAFTVGMQNLAKNFSTAGHSLIARYSTVSKAFYVGLANTIDTPLNVVWIALYEGEYTPETLPSYVPKGYAAELLECQVYFHLYATQAARPTHGLDCVPHMRINNPTQGTIVIDGVTYYYNSAEL